MRIQSTVDVYGLSPRPHGKIMREVNRETGERHARRRIRRHFARNRWTQPGGPYGYLQRTRRTQERKARQGFDPWRPNYQTGALQSSILSSSVVRATQHRWTYTARNAGSWAMNYERRKELEALAPDEIADDTKFMGDRYTQKAKAYQKTRIRRRKVG